MRESEEEMHRANNAWLKKKTRKMPYIGLRGIHCDAIQNTFDAITSQDRKANMSISRVEELIDVEDRSYQSTGVVHHRTRKRGTAMNIHYDLMVFTNIYAA